MNVFDLTKLELDPAAGGNCNAFYQSDLFNARVIVLKAGQRIPDCHMKAYVMFYVVKGRVEVKRNGEAVSLGENQVFITEPAVLSMESAEGARLMGVQISAKKEETPQ